MTKTNMDLSELLAKHDQGDLLRGIAEAVLQLIMETDVDGLIGAGRHERSGERTIWRNGYRDRALDTRLGTLNLRVPKLRQGSYFPGFLEARKTSEQALVAVIQEAWIGGASTRLIMPSGHPGNYTSLTDATLKPQFSNADRFGTSGNVFREETSGSTCGRDHRVNQRLASAGADNLGVVRFACKHRFYHWRKELQGQVLIVRVE